MLGLFIISSDLLDDGVASVDLLDTLLQFRLHLLYLRFQDASSIV